MELNFDSSLDEIEKIIPSPKINTKNIKDLFSECEESKSNIDSKINKEKRNIYPIVTDDNNNILWIPGIKKSDFDRLTVEFLAGYYGYSVEYLSQFEYGIHSWSGRYNVERRNF